MREQNQGRSRKNIPEKKMESSDRVEGDKIIDKVIRKDKRKAAGQIRSKIREVKGESEQRGRKNQETKMGRKEKKGWQR